MKSRTHKLIEKRTKRESEERFDPVAIAAAGQLHTDFTASERFKLREALLNGITKLVDLSTITGVCAVAVWREIQTNKDMQELYDIARKTLAKIAEDHAFDIAMDGKGMTNEKMVEHITKYNLPETYSDVAVEQRFNVPHKSVNIILAGSMPEIPVDENGIPMSPNDFKVLNSPLKDA